MDSRPREGAQSQKLRAAVPETGCVCVWETSLVLDHHQAALGILIQKAWDGPPLLGPFAARLRSDMGAWLRLGLTAGELFQAPLSASKFTPLPRLHLDIFWVEQPFLTGGQASVAAVWGSWLCPQGLLGRLQVSRPASPGCGKISAAPSSLGLPPFPPP